MKRCINLSICLFACLGLGACASVQPLPADRVQRLLDDTAFAPPAASTAAAIALATAPDSVFALSPQMQQALERDAGTRLRTPDPRQRLLRLLQGSGGPILEYESTQTRTAAEAFEARAGNCLSLVIMTAALAKAMGVPVGFQSVYVEESWSRSGDFYFASGHVNLLLGRRSPLARPAGDSGAEMVIDFLPSAELRGQRSRPIDERTVVAMFMNNRAAESLARGALDDAYWWVRQALLRDSALPAAYNTLGVVFLRHARPQQAQAALEEALRLDPGNTRALANLLPALKAQGRVDAAAAAAARLAQLESTAPFYWLDAGLAAMRQRDYARARELFARELKRDPDYPELHFWLAQAEAALGNLVQARRHLERAAQTATTGKDLALYAAKLDRLRALGLNQQAH